MGKQIATYNNKVKQLVPGYDLKSYSPGTITVTRNSVENEQYASWSLNEDEQGMYIKQYSIGDGKTGYSSNQLVAMVDLYYRYLSPINGENYEGGERPYQLGDDGCIEIDNLSKTIEKGASYEFTLTPKPGFSMVPAGHIEVKEGSDWSSIDISWENTEGAVNITIPSDKITGNLRFALNDCLYKLYILKTVDGHDYGDPEEIGIQNCSDTVNVDSLKPAENPTGTHFVNITKDGAAISGNQQFCGDTTLNVNYEINQYTIDTNGVNSDCVNIVLNPNAQTIEHGESLTITLTPKEGKRNIGAGSITMGNTAVRTWTSERSVTETISSVEGDIVVIASCGEDDTYTVTVNWVDGQTTLHTETYVVQNGTSITPEDYVGDWTLPEGYYINSMSPAEGTSILVDSNKTITYNCRLQEYAINFVAGDGVTLNSLTPQRVIHGESLTINNVYEINQGYRNATETHTGNAGVSLDNGNVTVTNVKSDVTITISASQTPSYYVSFAFDDPNAGTLSHDRVQVLEGECAEIEYSINDEYYTLDTITKDGPGTETHTSNTITICDVTGDVNVTINTKELYRVTYELGGDGIQLYKDGQTISSYTDVIKEGNCSEIGYVLTENYKFDKATSSVPSIIPNVDTTNKTVEVCPTRNVTITLNASLTHDYRLVNITSSQMDAMGGIVLTATLRDNVTYETITDTEQSNFEVKSINGENVSSKVVTVYDHESGENTTKTVVLNKTNSDDSTVTLRNVVVSYKGEDKTIYSITQRGEVYGYYSDLSNHTWVDASTSKSNVTGWLLDYGDGQGCTKKDKYNLDTTPYNEAGQKILENPIDNGIYQGTQNYASAVSGNKDSRNRNYHMSWIKDDDYRIFTSDLFKISSDICGNELEWTGEYVHISPEYELNYSYPMHCYGRTSINYYEADDDFKFINNNSSYKYSYPKHLSFKEITKENKFYYWSDICKLGYPTTTGQEADSQHQETTRWTDNVNDTKYDYNNPVTAHGSLYDFSSNDNLKESRTIYAYYTFLSPEVCIRDSNNNIVRDISDASEITNYETQGSPITTKYNTISSDSQSQDYDWDGGIYLENSDGGNNILCLDPWEKILSDSVYYYYPRGSYDKGLWWFFDDGSGTGAKNNGTIIEKNNNYYYKSNIYTWKDDEQLIIDIIDAVLKPGTYIQPNDTFGDLGADDLDISTIRSHVEDELDITIPDDMVFDTTDSVASFVDYILIDIQGKDPYDRDNKIQVTKSLISPYYYHKNNSESFSFSTNTGCYVTYDGPGTMTIGTDTVTCPNPGRLYVEGDENNNYFSVTIDSGENSCGGDVTVETSDGLKSLEGTIGGSENASDNPCDSGYMYDWEQLKILGCNVDG